ncbi:MAG: DEAD/DEAH box helicase [Holophagales bacterium]|nr:DEAD/DEAH box helicase [Holophagales bacterium]
MENSTFESLGCDAPYLVALENRGFTSPTPVQSECFAPGLEGRDLLVQSRTGSGKTLAFGLPLMHRLKEDRHPQAIILTPTRELAQQVAHELRSVNRSLDMAQLVGGMSYTPQLRSLSEGAKVIVGTPGRVMDHMERGTLDLSHIHMVVLDECDEMLNMGFIEDVERILSEVPSGPQTYLFSATLPAPIASLAKRFLKNPHRAEMTESGGVAQHADINHTACLIADHLHTKALANLLLHDEPSAALIFTKMKLQTEEVAEALRNAGLAADYLHGDLNQGARNRIMGSFKSGRLRYLVATDVAARGIDVEGLPLVVNIGIPTQFENYIHRTGRTGRAGSKGTSLSLVGHKESRILLAWARRGGLQLEWRAVPSPEEIRKERVHRLSERVSKQEAPAFESLAAEMLQNRPAEQLVAALLSMIEDDAHLGFDLPDAPELNKRKPKDFEPKQRRSSSRPQEKREKQREASADRPGRASRAGYQRRDDKGKTKGFFEDWKDKRDKNAKEGKKEQKDSKDKKAKREKEDKYDTPKKSKKVNTMPEWAAQRQKKSFSPRGSSSDGYSAKSKTGAKKKDKDKSYKSSSSYGAKAKKRKG